MDIETKLREALDGVTPGPWKVGAAGDICHGSGDWNGLKLYSGWVEGAWLGDIEAESNARLIALCSPDNIGALLDTIASLRSKLEEAEGADTVLVPRAEVERVTEIANRNEQSAEGDRLAVRLSASLREADHA